MQNSSCVCVCVRVYVCMCMCMCMHACVCVRLASETLSHVTLSHMCQTPLHTGCVIESTLLYLTDCVIKRRGSRMKCKG